MGTNYYVVKNEPSIRGAVAHIGKSSMGWLFLFHKVDAVWDDPAIRWGTYNEVMGWLKTHTTGPEPKYIIKNEYDETVSYEDFKTMVDLKQADERCRRNPENFSYCEYVDGYRFTDGEFS